MNTNYVRDRSIAFASAISRREALGCLTGAGVAAALLVTVGLDAANAQGTPEEGQEEANSFFLSGDEMRIGYGATSETGVPVLTYEGEFGSQTFEGDEIHAEECALGRLITCSLGAFPDRGELWLTLLLPAFNPIAIGDEPARFTTVAILKWLVSTIAGPPREGALEEYEVVALEGTAEFLVF